MKPLPSCAICTRSGGRHEPGGSHVVTIIDWVVVGAYFALLLGLTWWSILRNRDTVDDYFLAGRHLGWVVVGASIFASNIGSEHLVGLAGSGATSGVALAHFELHAWCLLVLGWVMVPFYMRSGVYTMPEFLERRFSPTARWVLSLISLVAYVLTKMAVGIFAGGVVFGVLLPELQVHIGGAVVRKLLDRIGAGRGPDRSLHRGRRHARRGLHRHGADGRARARLAAADDVRPVGAWRLERAARRARSGDVQPVEADRAGRRSRARGRRSRRAGRMAWYFNQSYPWPGMLLCAPIIGLWYWCTDQYIVQRALGAKGEREARRGHDLRRVPQAAAALHLHRAGHDRRGAGPDADACPDWRRSSPPTGPPSRRQRRRRFR